MNGNFFFFEKKGIWPNSISIDQYETMRQNENKNKTVTLDDFLSFFFVLNSQRSFQYIRFRSTPIYRINGPIVLHTSTHTHTVKFRIKPYTRQ